MNTAFVFAKPHANTPGVLDAINAKFAEKGIKVLSEGVVTGEEIDKKGFIDQHYCARAGPPDLRPIQCTALLRWQRM